LESWLRLFLVYCNTKDKPLQTSAFPIKVSYIIQPDLIVNRAHFRFMVPFLNCKKNTQTSFIFCSKNGFCPRGSPGAVPLHPGEEPNDHVVFFRILKNTELGLICAIRIRKLMFSKTIK
jgi:hypothetical protein